MFSPFPSGWRYQREDLKKGASILKGPQGYHCDPTGKNKVCVSMLLKLSEVAIAKKERGKEGEKKRKPYRSPS